MDAPNDAEIIRLWLETNFPEAMDAASLSVESLGDRIESLTPEVLAAMERIAAAEAEELERGKKLQDATLERDASLEKVTAALDKLEAEEIKAAEAAQQEAIALAEETQRALDAAEAQANAAPKYDAATQAVMSQIQAERLLAEALEDTVPAISNVAGVEEEAGFKGLASNALRAEKAVGALASGTGLGRLGSFLEPVTAALGGPAGLGMAIGAIAFGVEAVLPKLEKLWLAFAEGPKSVQDATTAMRRFDDSVAASDDRLMKRELAKIDKAVEELEISEQEHKDAGTAMPSEDKARLDALRRRSATGHERLEVDHALESVKGPTKSQRASGAAVREAIIEAGGLDAVLGENPDDVSKNVVASALKGDQMSIGTLARWSPDFATHWNEVDPAAKAAKKEQAKKDKEWERSAGISARILDQEEAAEDREKQKIARETDQAVAGMEQYTESWKREQLKELAAQQRKEQQERRKAEAEAKRQEREAAKYDKAHTPMALEAAARKEEQEQMAGVVAANTHGFAPDQQKQIAAAALKDVNLGMDLASAVRDAVYQTQQKIYKDYQAGMARQQVISESYYSAGGM